MVLDFLELLSLSLIIPEKSKRILKYSKIFRKCLSAENRKILIICTTAVHEANGVCLCAGQRIGGFTELCFAYAGSNM